MSPQTDSEDDVWQYKPLQKKKRTRQTSASVDKRKRGSVKTCRSQDNHETPTGSGGDKVSHHPAKTDEGAEESSSGGFCPLCQMPFSILLVQSQRWHVSECLDSPRDECPECPDGLRCSSTIPNHYRRFSHTLLAQSRASGGTPTVSATPHSESAGLRCPPADTDWTGCSSETSQDGGLIDTPASSGHSVSPERRGGGSPPTKLPNGLLLLRSPGPEDFKKKKGWLSSSQSQKSITSSQESKQELLTPPAKEGGGNLAEYDEAVSYSPLSELPADSGVADAACRKVLFNHGRAQNQDQNQDHSFSSDDELFAEYIENDLEEKDWSSCSSQLASVSSAAASTNTPAEETPSQSTEISRSSEKSPQSRVLERLRDSLCLNNGSTQTPPALQPHSMAPLGGHGGAPARRQTDIGVFFGLKPLKETGPKEQSAPPSGGGSSGRKRPRSERQKKPRAERSGAASPAAGPASNSQGASVRGGAGGGGWRGRRWNRTDADGEVQLPRCPFYKKIPGTKFAVDAFRYGDVEGITAYFLTHFHSDHYGGLTRRATFPIYCNKITGNLVKNKLKVEERYIHILPMNTKVTVDGVKVVLLDANHCPGAAMLLFFLPDGQTVLHTGDFRADPSMEADPHLLGCRVQTLYLDTTYLSPRYTFPTQQEAIQFAASTAFQSVTLNPRTLVVCGSYSVGKEKVFLALAEVLGSKVCLSRDKYNTMCCLEWPRIKERLTTDWRAGRVHVLPMMHLTFSKLQDHLDRFSQQYDQLLAFKPSGWTFSQQGASVEDVEPEVSGNVSIYGVPYSEHSSFEELRRFVQWLRPLKIIPTVNGGSWSSRRAMGKCFTEWLARPEGVHL